MYSFESVRTVPEGSSRFHRKFILMDKYLIFEGERLSDGHMYLVHQKILHYNGHREEKSAKMNLHEVNRMFQKLDSLDTSDHVSDMIANRPISMRMEYPNCCGFQDHLTYGRR